MRILIVDACARAEDSRTRRLLEHFLCQLRELMPEAEIVRHDLYRMQLKPVDAGILERKESLCDRREWQDPLFGPANDFRDADAVVIAAPYWDLSFPSVLKIWVENIYARNLTFRYEADRCIGLAKGKYCVYLTTAGSPIGADDWGRQYIFAVMRALGIREHLSVSA